MKAYKLTSSDHRTRNKTQWGENITHTAANLCGYDESLCSIGWIHFYTHPLIAVLMNPVHAGFSNPVLWECETSGDHKHESLKSGCKILTTIKIIPLPDVSLISKVAFGILCAKCVTKDTKWNLWADQWLNNEDRSKSVAAATANAAGANTYAAYAAYAYAATYASNAYVFAAEAAAADAATYAAANAANISINFIEIAKQALTYK